MAAIRSDIISCEEEERGIQGYEISSHYSPRPQRQRGIKIMGQDDASLILSYEHNGRITTINHGSRTKRENRIRIQPFHYCSACHEWLSEKGLREHLDPNSTNICRSNGTPDDIIREAWIFLEGSHDVIQIEIPKPPEITDILSYYTTSKETFLQSIIRTFHLDENEVDAFIAPDPENKEQHKIVIYEVEEGGLGILHSLFKNNDLLKRVIENTLEVIHIDSNKLQENEDACAKACYNCLLHYWNQREHRFIDRKMIKDTLIQLQNPKIETYNPAEDHYLALYKQTESTLEKDVLKEIKKNGFRLPDEAQKIISEGDEPIVSVDLFYKPNICVFINGPAHQKDYVEFADKRKRRRLKNLGYRVISIKSPDAITILSTL